MLTIDAIARYLPYVLERTSLDFIGERRQGKVRDVYDDGHRLYLVATDRYSAFDRNLALVPLKGHILTQTSLHNFVQTEDLVPNHVIASPDPNVIVCQKCTVAPVEVIVRGYLTGVTDTALWTRYERGQRDFTDFVLPDDMPKNAALEHPVITPTTKFEAHDRNLTCAEVVLDGYLSQVQWDQIAEVALRLFARGQEVAARAGLILVDTKYEFGYDIDGTLTLIDEVHTQDSSRYWIAASYHERTAAGQEPEFFDKEFLRLWFKERCDPYADAALPDAPEELRIELARRYVDIYERLAGRELELPPLMNPSERIEQNLRRYGVGEKRE